MDVWYRCKSQAKENRRKALEEQDEAERKALAKRNDDVTDEEEMDEKITDLLQHNAAFKTIQILGQVLKNFTGSLRGGPKRPLVEECYGLGLRVLGNIFQMAEEGFPHLVEIIASQGKAREKPLSTAEIQKQVSQLFFGLLQMVSYSVFKHVSDSVGTEKVAQTLEELLRNDENPSIKVIDLSIRLDHYDQFPQSQILDLSKRFDGNMFALSLVRYLVWTHLYMFRVDYKDKQFACEKLGIAIENQNKLLAMGKKKVNTRRSGAGKPKRKGKVATGSSAEERRLPTRSGVASMVFVALSALMCSASSETLGRGLVPGSGAALERLALSWSRTAVSWDR